MTISASGAIPTPSSASERRVDTQIQLVKVGVNYQRHPGGFFGWF
jgi:hypothetical protein